VARSIESLWKVRCQSATGRIGPDGKGDQRLTELGHDQGERAAAQGDALTTSSALVMS
jgi:hypothetical protein